MELRLQVHLPGDAGGIPVARRLLRSSLTAIGVARECVDDLELALTEACTNVLRHAGVTNHFEVTAAVAEGRCVIEVIDRGMGFDPTAAGAELAADLEAEHGRGLHLMRALLDQLDFATPVGGGTVARLAKTLSWDPGAIAGYAGAPPTRPFAPPPPGGTPPPD